MASGSVVPFNSTAAVGYSIVNSTGVWNSFTSTVAVAQLPLFKTTLKVKLSTNSSAVDVSVAEAKTNAAGLAKFTVSSSVAGDFKVYVEYGTKADCELLVKLWLHGQLLQCIRFCLVLQLQIYRALQRQIRDDIVLDITNGDGAEYYLFAMKNDSVNKGLGITTGSAISGQIVIKDPDICAFSVTVRHRWIFKTHEF